MKILEDRGYTYKKHLSTGGEGEVHLIKSVDKEFIAKIFPKISDESMDILKTIQKLNIDGIPKIHEIFHYQDKTFIIRDYVEGTTLYDEIRKNEYLSFKRAKTIIVNVCQTLKQLHRAKPHPIIYRDLKPENIIVTPEGKIQLIDFGIARYYKLESTRDTVLAGTRGYTAPEVMAGMQSDQRSDVYSAGLLLYEMVTGKNLLIPPFQIRPVKESNEYLPDWLDDVIAKATDMNQTRRYSTIEDFINAIENPVAAKPKRKKTTSLNKKFSKIFAVIFTLVIFTVAVFALYTIFKNKNHSETVSPPTPTEVINNTVSEATLEMPAEKYNIFIDLEFDDEEDKSWVNDYDEIDNVEYGDSQLIIAKGCNIDYIIKPGMFVHYKAIHAKYGSVGVGPYRINGPINFEAIYTNTDENCDYTTSMIYFDGTPFKNNRQVIDTIIYISGDYSAVYAIAVDDENKKICYISYKIPESIKEIPLCLAINNFTDGMEKTLIDSVIVANGSLRKYLEDNFESYNEYKDLVDDFLSKKTESMDEMIIKPVDDWN